MCSLPDFILRPVFLYREREIGLAGDVTFPSSAVENLPDTNKIPPKEMVSVDSFDRIAEFQIPLDRRDILY